MRKMVLPLVIALVVLTAAFAVVLEGSYKTKEMKSPLQMIQYIFRNGKTFYIISTGCTSDCFEEFRKLFEEVAKSVELKKP